MHRAGRGILFIKILIPAIVGAGIGFCWAWDRYRILNREKFRNRLRIGIRSHRPILIRELLDRIRYVLPRAGLGACGGAILWWLRS
jgi:hypothetical protein